jgi:catechol 2,3-dioxygenase-like lactoylglutathione lyase family enzyme
MIRVCRCLIAAVSLLIAAAPASAQLIQAHDHPIVFGHLHLHPTSVDAHKKFWVDTLGGTPTKIGTIDAVLFPDVVVELGSPSFGSTPPSGGTAGTVVDHIGFTVSNLSAVLAKVMAGGYPIVERRKMSAFVVGPDGFKLELTEAKKQKIPIAMDHVHFMTPKTGELKAWYSKLVGVNVRGARLMYSRAATGLRGTKGRVLDHIGFEIKNLEAFAKNLEAGGVKLDRPFMKTTLGAYGPFSLVYLTDPSGTYMELTEGLNRAK